jgi:hypothetical protein
MRSKLPSAWFIAAICLLFAGCNYDVPLTAQPTRKVDPRVLGDWVSFDKDSQQVEQMHVRKLDDSTYVVSIDHDIYRAFHSDFADTAFVSVQDLNSEECKYVYYVWQLSADGTQLSLKGVSNKVVPEATKGRETLQKLIKANLSNPKLYGDEIKFTRKKRNF